MEPLRIRRQSVKSTGDEYEEETSGMYTDCHHRTRFLHSLIRFPEQ